MSTDVPDRLTENPLSAGPIRRNLLAATDGGLEAIADDVDGAELALEAGAGLVCRKTIAPATMSKAAKIPRAVRADRFRGGLIQPPTTPMAAPITNSPMARPSDRMDGMIVPNVDT